MRARGETEARHIATGSTGSCRPSLRRVRCLVSWISNRQGSADVKRRSAVDRPGESIGRLYNNISEEAKRLWRGLWTLRCDLPDPTERGDLRSWPACKPRTFRWKRNSSRFCWTLSTGWTTDMALGFWAGDWEACFQSGHNIWEPTLGRWGRGSSCL